MGSNGKSKERVFNPERRRTNATVTCAAAQIPLRRLSPKLSFWGSREHSVTSLRQSRRRAKSA